MKKMKSLFVREYDENGDFTSTNKVTEGCEWVINGEGKATRKFDGTCCLIKDGEIYRRYDAKNGKKPPEGAIPCQDAPDPNTTHFPHWLKCDPDNPADKHHINAFRKYENLPDGTYELCGVHFQNNIDWLVEEGDILIKHGDMVYEIKDRSFDGIKEFLTHNYIEGIVFHRENGEMCKVKRSDFGLPWGNSKGVRHKA